MKATTACMIVNCTAIIAFAALAYLLGKWWVVLFAALFLFNTKTEAEAGNYKEFKTHGGQLRAMTDEELATVIAWPYIASPPWCAEHTTCPYINEDPTPCDKCALDWLRQEVTDDP